jgi:predicted RNase H-like HicB family nuclease
MDIDYNVQIWREGKQFIAHAMPLDVASCGETPEAARLALNEAVKLFITSAEEHGTLDEVLEACPGLLSFLRIVRFRFS